MLPIISNDFFAIFAMLLLADFQTMANSDKKIKQIQKQSENSLNSESGTCNLDPALVDEIASYSDVANTIFKTVISGAFKGKTYKELAYFVDRFGPRFAVSQALEKSIDFMMKKMKTDGLENVHGEQVRIPHWIRVDETATMTWPRKKNIALLGLGLSVGTPPLVGVTAEVLVVKSLQELEQKSMEVKGKIVLFNQFDEVAEKTLGFRMTANANASTYGAVATFFRSLTPVSINTPHAGVQFYAPNVRKIPSACITIEDSELLQRLQNRGETPKIHLIMNDYNLLPTTSRNLIGEILGREKPEEVVIVSGHIDSWDVGQGAMDDGGGIFVTQEALAVIKHLNLRPRRTLRGIYWTTEELGLYGVKAYIQQHRNELEKISAAFESDIGNFKPLGLDFIGNKDAGCIIKEVVKLLTPLNATYYRNVKSIGIGTDIDELVTLGVPAVAIRTQNDKYFWFHHTQADTMTVQNTDDLDLCTAVWAAASYVVADISVSLPRT